IVCLAAVAVAAQTAPPPAPGGQRLPGVELAQTLATATGIAISPLFGVSAVGAWRYLQAEPVERQALPWFASMWFWVPGLLVSFLLVSKDLLLGFLPGVKKPLDALDVLEDKVSAVLAIPAVVPMFASAFAGVASAPATAGPVAQQAGAAALSWLDDLPGATALGIGSVVLVAAFLVVWLASHAINVLILLSPFGPLDLLLRSVKWALLALLGGATLIHPYLGLLVAVLILLAAVPVAGWSFRLSVFGWVLALDLIRGGSRGAPGRIRAFTVGRLGRAPARSYGVVTREEGGLVFRYRPWMVMPLRRERLAEGVYRLGRGPICPILRRQEEGRAVAVLRLPPRYARDEEEVLAALRLAGADDLALRRGLRACLAWLREGVAEARPPVA
ncbi:MAG: hypothetical protein R3325_02140, partial [Thermoanaerobaculia bacterium]|nr:hypothetical protein [Thermoanaerobaculia bacterium]